MVIKQGMWQSEVRGESSRVEIGWEIVIDHHWKRRDMEAPTRYICSYQY